jgi:hypothetical protein
MPRALTLSVVLTVALTVAVVLALLEAPALTWWVLGGLACALPALDGLIQTTARPGGRGRWLLWALALAHFAIWATALSHSAARTWEHPLVGAGDYGRALLRACVRARGP